MLKQLQPYQVLQERRMEELKSDGYLLEHKSPVPELSFYPTRMTTKYSVSGLEHLRVTIQVYLIFWSIPYCAGPRSFLQRTPSWSC